MISDSWTGTIFLGIIAFGVLWFGWNRGFFHWDPNRSWITPISLIHILIPFAIYFSIIYFLAPLLVFLIKHLLAKTQINIGLAVWIHFFLSGITLSAILLYWSSLKQPLQRMIWQKDPRSSKVGKDFAFAFYAWCLSFPLVLFLSQLLEKLVYFVFKISKIPEQVAVDFVKMTFHHPLYFFLATVTVVIFAPLIEEMLFRGFLQTFMRQTVGPKLAILISSFCFSLFHFSPEQGLGNIPILASLFALALFLGFVYEKQGSLFASISLHSLFNAISIVNLYFLGGIQAPL